MHQNLRKLNRHMCFKMMPETFVEWFVDKRTCNTASQNYNRGSVIIMDLFRLGILVV